jgi:RNA polymerase sigma factor (sigma-70 family)
MGQPELIPHLFRTEYRKIVSVLIKKFGFAQAEIAEDLTMDTFLVAAQTWALNGLPSHPVAWLYRVAKNKATNHLRRDSVFAQKIAPLIKREYQDSDMFEIDLSARNITDSQLQMMFAICHPCISAEAQIGLSLRILCGFGIQEIADAFISNRETISKRLTRAREKLREEKITIEMPGSSEIEARMENVLTTIYLLFNEGYYSMSQDQTLRKDLCLEAMRLCTMLVEHEATNSAQANALLALMCFHASRFDARLDEQGDPVLYEDQDESLWNPELISRGGYFLHCASGGKTISKYHLEAAIAYWGTRKTDAQEKWENVLKLHDLLLEISYSPVAALHRAYAFSKIHGKTAAIRETEKLSLIENQLYFLLLGELYLDCDRTKAKENFKKALELAKSDAGRRAIENKIELL